MLDTRSLCLVAVSLTACMDVGRLVEPGDVSRPPPGYGILEIGVDSDQTIDTLDVCSDRGCVDTGSFADAQDIHYLHLLVGEYCVTRLTAPAWNSGGVSILEFHEDAMCFQITEGRRTYPGHVKLIHQPTPYASDRVRIGFVRPGASGEPPNAKQPTQPSAPTSPSPAGDDELPELLDARRIKIGVDRLKPAVHACGREVGLEPRAHVQVKFAIDGPSGAPVEVELIDPAPNTVLAACIQGAATAQGPGTFPSFRADRQAFQFRFRLP